MTCFLHFLVHMYVYWYSTCVVHVVVHVCMYVMYTYMCAHVIIFHDYFS
jgi:hypothetical protein